MRNFVLVATAVVLLGGAAVAAFVYPETVVSLANSSFFGCGASGCCSPCDTCCPLSASEESSAQPACCREEK